MKIEYQIKKDKRKYNDYAFFVKVYKKSFKKNPNKKLTRYTTHFLKITLLSYLIFLIFLVIIFKTPISKDVAEFMSLFITGMLSFLLMIYLTIRKGKDTQGKSILLVNEEGITDQTEELTISYSYDQIDFLYLHNEFGVIIPKNTDIIVYFANVDKEKLKKAIRKYNKDVMIMDNEDK